MAMKRLPRYRRPITRSRYLAVLLVLIMLPLGAAIWIRPCLSQVRQGLAPQSAVTRQALPPNPAHGRWDLLPRAPITVRQEAVHVWTGTELVVWGGLIYSHDEPIFGDGAAYNPTTHRWRRLPASPLVPRFGATGVWTGRELVIWGGEGNSLTAFNDGAAYDPVLDSWRRIKPAPITGRVWPFATWTGLKMLVWGGQPAIKTTEYADGGLYDPRSDSWETISAAPFPPNHPPLVAVPVWNGRLLYAWSTWARHDQVSPGMFTTSEGTDVAVYDPARTVWSSLTPMGQGPWLVSAGLWTGKQILVREGGFIGPSPCCQSFRLHAYDPIANSWTAVAPGDMDAADLVLTWVRGGLIVENGGAQLAGPDGRQIVPGDSAEYLPAQDRWISLPGAPNGGPGGAPGIWTGHSILYWGNRYPPGQPGMSFTP